MCKSEASELTVTLHFLVQGLTNSTRLQHLNALKTVSLLFHPPFYNVLKNMHFVDLYGRL